MLQGRVTQQLAEVLHGDGKAMVSQYGAILKPIPGRHAAAA